MYGSDDLGYSINSGQDENGIDNIELIHPFDQNMQNVIKTNDMDINCINLISYSKDDNFRILDFNSIIILPVQNTRINIRNTELDTENSVDLANGDILYINKLSSDIDDNKYIMSIDDDCIILNLDNITVPLDHNKLSLIIDTIKSKNASMKAKMFDDSFKYDVNLYFPSNKSADMSKLILTNVSIYSTTHQKESFFIQNLITSKAEEIFNKKTTELVITDGTANVGGDTINFAYFFKSVNSIEIDELTYSVLKNNVDVYNLKNVNTYNNDYTEVYDQLEQDVVFIDAPWTGKKYKEHETLQLELSGINIADLVKNILVENMSKLVILKVPYNYDIENLNAVMNDEYNISIDDVKNSSKSRTIYKIICIH
jgi:16S rRNA G966 N2-methylase RsmD